MTIKVSKKQAASAFWLSYVPVVDRAFFDWAYSAFRNKALVSDREAQKVLRELVCKAIEQQPKPISVVLSGGIDSTFILLMALECFPASDITACNVSFAEGGYNEIEKARRVAGMVGVDMATTECGPSHVAKVLRGLNNETVQELFFSSSLVPTAVAYDLASLHGETILTGDGGDELFCGYDRTIYMNKLRRVSEWVQSLLYKIFHSDTYSTDRRRKVVESLKYGYETTVAVWPPLQAFNLTGTLPATDSFRNVFDKCLWCEDLHYVERLMLFDIVTELFGVEVPKVETAARIADTAKVASPFLAQDVFDYACSLPLTYKLSSFGTRKWLLRQMINQRLPKLKLPRKKRGFAVPIGQWLQEEKVRWPTEIPWVRKDFVEKILAEHKNGQGDHAQRLWSLMKWASLTKKGIVELK